MTSLPFLYNDFHGGLNTKDAPYLLTDDQSRDLMNIQGTTAGAIVKRTGLNTLATPAVTFTSLAPCEATGTTFLVGAGSTSLYSVTAGGTVTAIKTGLTSGKRWEFISAPVVAGQGPLYGMNGTDPPQQWTGSGNTVAWTATDSGGTLPNGTFCIYSQNQAFVSGVASNPSRLYWSGIADPTAWNPANLNGSGFADFDPNDGQSISAIGFVGPYVLVAKPRKLWVLLSTATSQTRRLSTNIGCVAHRSLAVAPEGTYFLAEDRGVYLTNGTKIEAISDVIQPTIDSIQTRSQCSGTYFNGHYYLSAPITTSNNDTTLDWDSTLSSWWRHSFGSNQFAVWHPSASAGLYSAKGTAAFVEQAFTPNVFQDNGANYTWYWRGPWQSPTFYRRRRFPTPFYKKRLRQVRYDGSGQVDFSLATNFAGAESLLHSDVFSFTSTATNFGGADSTVYGGADGTAFGGVQSIIEARAYTPAQPANAYSIVFSATNANPATVTSYVLMITDRKDLVVS